MDSLERTPRSPWRRAALVAFGLIASLLLCFVTALGGPFVVEGLGHVFLGWLAFPAEVLPRIELNPIALATAVVCLVALAGGGHVFASWLRSSLDPAATPWRARWTGAVLGMVVLAFVAGISAVGVTHQTAWLATSPERLTRGSWPVLAEFPVMDALEEVGVAQRRFRERSDRYGTLSDLVAAGLVSPSLERSLLDYSLDVGPSVTEPGERWFAAAFSRRHGCRQFFADSSGAYQSSGEPCAVDRATCAAPAGFFPMK